MIWQIFLSPIEFSEKKRPLAETSCFSAQNSVHIHLKRLHKCSFMTYLVRKIWWTPNSSRMWPEFCEHCKQNSDQESSWSQLLTQNSAQLHHDTYESNKGNLGNLILFFFFIGTLSLLVSLLWTVQVAAILTKLYLIGDPQRHLSELTRVSLAMTG